MYWDKEAKNLADSNITKRALAAALKELMEDISFDKITVGHICTKCEMNRKSFYYHFKDKYDLVNWIYYTEFVDTLKGWHYKNGLDFLLDVCIYLEENKKFYRKVLKYDGQNSFFDYFKEIIIPVVENYTSKIFADDENNKFYVEFFSDAFLNAIRKWVLSSDDMPAKEFIFLIRSCIYGTAKKVMGDITKDE